MVHMARQKASQMNFLTEKVLAQTIFFLFHAALVVEGEMLWLSKVTRSEMGAYLCIASNAVPPSVSKRIKLQVHCKYAYNFCSLILFTFNFRCIEKRNLIQISAPPEICIINFRRMIYVDIFFTFDNPKASRFTSSEIYWREYIYFISVYTLVHKNTEKKDTNNSLGGVVVHCDIRIIEKHTLTLHIQNKIFEIETKT